MRSRHNLAIATALLGSVALLLVDIRFAPTFNYRVAQPDFYVYYLAAQVGRTLGWSAMYDPAVFQPAVTAATGRYLPYLNPPVLAWLVIALSWLPYQLAAYLWTGLLAGSLALVWFIAAPGRQLPRFIHLVAAAALLPVFVSFMFGQVTLVIVAGVAISWWLLDRGRPGLAGVALAALALKPQIAFLVPFGLLAAGYWRVFLGWVMVTMPLAVIGLLAVGTEVFHHVNQSLHLVSGVPGPTQASLGRQLPLPMAAVAIVVAVSLFLFVAYRARGKGPGLPIAAGLVTSVLISPYVNFFDLSCLVLAAWLVWRTDPVGWHRGMILILYPAVYLAPIWPLVALAGECGLLIGLVALAAPSTRNAPNETKQIRAAA